MNCLCVESRNKGIGHKNIKKLLLVLVRGVGVRCVHMAAWQALGDEIEFASTSFKKQTSCVMQ
jgi:hypothetical protein